MAYITVVLALALVCWLVLAARGTDTSRIDSAAAAAAAGSPTGEQVSRTSPHRDRGARGRDQLADHRRARDLAHDQQAA